MMLVWLCIRMRTFRLKRKRQFGMLINWCEKQRERNREVFNNSSRRSNSILADNDTHQRSQPTALSRLCHVSRCCHFFNFVKRPTDYDKFVGLETSIRTRKALAAELYAVARNHSQFAFPIYDLWTFARHQQRKIDFFAMPKLKKINQWLASRTLSISDLHLEVLQP